MSSQAARRSELKSLSCLLQFQGQLSMQEEAAPVQLQLKSQKMDIDKQEEQFLFERVLKFVSQFFNNEIFHKELADSLNKNKSTKYIGSSKQNQRVLSFKKMNMGSRICFDGEVSRKECVPSCNDNLRVSRGNNKKISIFVMQEGNSESSQELYSDQIFSQTSVKTIRSIEIPHLDMTVETIAQIYQSPQPFLINLSLCLFVRYCLSTKHKVTFEASSWVLTVSTIIAYKLYYDEEIEGLMECFMGVMGIARKDLIDLERCFFEAIDYNTVISNYDYHFVLAKLLAQGTTPQKVKSD